MQKLSVGVKYRICLPDDIETNQVITITRVTRSRVSYLNERGEKKTFHPDTPFGNSLTKLEADDV